MGSGLSLEMGPQCPPQLIPHGVTAVTATEQRRAQALSKKPSTLPIGELATQKGKGPAKVTLQGLTHVPTRWALTLESSWAQWGL